MNNYLKRFLAILLLLVMCLSLVPTAAFADAIADETTVEEAEDEDEDVVEEEAEEEDPANPTQTPAPTTPQEETEEETEEETGESKTITFKFQLFTNYPYSYTDTSGDNGENTSLANDTLSFEVSATIDSNNNITITAMDYDYLPSYAEAFPNSAQPFGYSFTNWKDLSRDKSYDAGTLIQEIIDNINPNYQLIKDTADYSINLNAQWMLNNDVKSIIYNVRFTLRWKDYKYDSYIFDDTQRGKQSWQLSNPMQRNTLDSFYINSDVNYLDYFEYRASDGNVTDRQFLGYGVGLLGYPIINYPYREPISIYNIVLDFLSALYAEQQDNFDVDATYNIDIEPNTPEIKLVTVNYHIKGNKYFADFVGHEDVEEENGIKTFTKHYFADANDNICLNKYESLNPNYSKDKPIKKNNKYSLDIEAASTDMWVFTGWSEKDGDNTPEYIADENLIIYNRDRGRVIDLYACFEDTQFYIYWYQNQLLENESAIIKYYKDQGMSEEDAKEYAEEQIKNFSIDGESKGYHDSVTMPDCRLPRWLMQTEAGQYSPEGWSVIRQALDGDPVPSQFSIGQTYKMKNVYSLWHEQSSDDKDDLTKAGQHKMHLYLTWKPEWEVELWYVIPQSNCQPQQEIQKFDSIFVQPQTDENGNQYVSLTEADLRKSVALAGYTFNGWYNDITGTKKVTTDTRFTLFATAKIYAFMTPKNYTLKFTANYPSVESPYAFRYQSGSMNDLLCTFNNEVTLPACGYSFDYYKFNGWKLGSAATKIKYSDGETIKNPLSFIGIVDADHPDGYYIDKLTLLGDWSLDTTAWATADKKITFADGFGGVSKTYKLNTPYGVQSVSFTTPADRNDSDGDVIRARSWTCTAGNLKGSTYLTDYQFVYNVPESYTFTANWDKIGTTVRFNPNGGDGSMDSQFITYGKTEPLRKNTFSLLGKQFDCWSNNADGKAPWYEDNSSLSGANGIETLILYAKWVTAKHQVTLDYNDGRHNVDYKYSDGVAFELPTLVREGYIHTGWKQQGYDTVFTPGQKLSFYSNITFVAQWEKKFVLTLKHNDGTGTSDTIYLEPTEPGSGSYEFDFRTVNITRQGYKLVSWSASSGLTYKTNKAYTFTGKSAILTADWSPCDTITIKFHANGGTGTQADMYVARETVFITLPDCSYTAPDGKRFNAWKIDGRTYNCQNYSGSSKGTATSTSYVVSRDAADVIDAYAVWVDIDYRIYYDYSYTKTYKTYTASSFVLPSNDSHTFDDDVISKVTGWVQEGFPDTVYAPGTTLTTHMKNATFIAQWETSLYKYTIKDSSHSFSGEEYQSIKMWWDPDGYIIYPYDFAFKYPYNRRYVEKNSTWMAPIGKTNYHSIDYWDASDGNRYIAGQTYPCPKENITLTAHWKVDSYFIIKFSPGEGVDDTSGTMTSVAYEPGTYYSFPKSCSITRPGYTFTGYWLSGSAKYSYYTNNSKMFTQAELENSLPSRILYVYPEWTPNKYTVTYHRDLDDKYAKEIVSCEFDKAYALKSPTELNVSQYNYVFTGWNTSRSGNGTNFVYSNGQFTPSTFTNLVPKTKSTTNRYIDLYPMFKLDSTIPAKVYFNFNCSGAQLPSGATSITPLAGYLGVASHIPNTIPERSGTSYRFKCWNTRSDGLGVSYSPGENITPTERSITLYAQWAQPICNVTFDANGGTLVSTFRTVKAEYNQIVELPQAKRSHYTLSGWTTKKEGPGPDNKVYNNTMKYTWATDRTFYAQWIGDPVHITYNKNTGSGTMYDTNAKYGDKVRISQNAFTKSGYKFVSWNTKKDGTGTEYKQNCDYTITGDLTLYAQWTDVRYTISFVPGNNLTMSPVTCTYGGQLRLCSPGRVPGYEFLGWNTKKDGTGVHYAEDGVLRNVLSNITLYGEWKTVGHTVSFEANGGTGYIKPMVFDGPKDVKTLPTTGFTKKGYRITAWKTTPSGSGSQFVAGNTLTNVTKDLTLYAVWTPITYTIKFLANGGEFSSTPSDIHCVYGKSYTLPNPSLKSTLPGLSFVGWYADNDPGRIYNPGESVINLTDINDDTVTMRVKWGIAHVFNFYVEKKLYKTTSYRDGSIVTFGSAVHTTDKTKIFWYWLDRAHGLKYYNGSTMKATSPMNFDAVFRNQYIYTLTFLSAPGSNGPKSIKKTENVPIRIPSTIPTRSGYRFTGWRLDGTTEIYSPASLYTKNQSANFTAQWERGEPVTYRVKYHSVGVGDDVLYESMPQNQDKYEGLNLELSTTVPERYGYIFKGWATSNGGSVVYKPGDIYTKDEPIDLYAVWSIRTYTITIVANGNVSHVYDIKYGDIYDYREPRKTGYTFMGWTVDNSADTRIGCPQIICFGNYTYYALWRSNSMSSYTTYGNWMTEAGVVSENTYDSQITAEYNNLKSDCRRNLYPNAVNIKDTWYSWTYKSVSGRVVSGSGWYDKYLTVANYNIISLSTRERDRWTMIEYTYEWRERITVWDYTWVIG